MGYCFYNYSPSWDVSAQGLSSWISDYTILHGTPLYHVHILYSGLSAEVFQAQQLILLVVFGAVYEPLASCVVVQLEIYVSKRKLVCKTRWRGIFYRCLVFTGGQFWYSGTVVACVCPSVRPSVRHQVFFRAITHYPFKPGSPNLDHRCERPWLIFYILVERSEINEPSFQRLGLEFTSSYRFSQNYNYLTCRNFICQQSAITETTVK